MCKIPTLGEAGWRYMGILCYFSSFQKWKRSYFCCLVTKLCLTLSDPMDYSLTRSFVHGISQARILQWVAISFSRGSSQPRNWTHISYNGRQMLYLWATWGSQISFNKDLFFTWQTYPLDFHFIFYDSKEVESTLITILEGMHYLSSSSPE